MLPVLPQTLPERECSTSLKKTVDPQGSLLVTDENYAYRTVRGILNHAVINHSKQYADGEVHTNTIEGFWALL